MSSATSPNSCANSIPISVSSEGLHRPGEVCNLLAKVEELVVEGPSRLDGERPDPVGREALSFEIPELPLHLLFQLVLSLRELVELLLHGGEPLRVVGLDPE